MGRLATGAAFCSMVLLLAVVDEGLAAGFAGSWDLDALRSLLGIPAEVTPVGVISIGHPAPDKRSPSLTRGRKAEGDYVHTAIGLFLQYLDQKRGAVLPVALANSWRPFAEATTESRRTVWAYRAPAAVLRMVDAAALDDFRACREAAGDSARTATIRVYAVRTMLAVAMRDGLLTGEQAQSLGLRVYRQRQPQDRSPVGRRLSPGEARLLREAVDTSTAKGARDLAILDTMLFLGLRREEVASLHLHHFHQDGGRWWVVFGGKGKKRRRLKVHDTLFQSLTAWLLAAELSSFDRGDHPTVRAIDTSMVGRVVAHYGHASGLAPANGKNQLSAHDLRHTCARNAFDNGASLLLVQAMLGHSDPKTTAQYIGAFEDDNETAVDFVRY